MARQRMSEKNTKKLSKKLGLKIRKILVRGNTNHRKDLFLESGEVVNLWPDGEITPD